jgi:hypothetical protein
LRGKYSHACGTDDVHVASFFARSTNVDLISHPYTLRIYNTRPRNRRVEDKLSIVATRIQEVIPGQCTTWRLVSSKAHCRIDEENEKGTTSIELLSSYNDT